MNTSKISLMNVSVIIGLWFYFVCFEVQSEELKHFSSYTFSVDGFQAEFPTKPIEVRVKGYFNSYQALVANPVSQYSIFVNHSTKKVFTDASIDAYLKGAIQGMMLNSKDPVLKFQRRIQFLGFTGLEYEFTQTIESSTIVGHGIIFIVDGNHIRLSQLYSAKDGSSATDAFNRFRKSFQLIPIDAPLSQVKFENSAQGILFSPPKGWQQKALKSPGIVVFSNHSGHSITVLDSDSPEYNCSHYKNEMKITQGFQSSDKFSSHEHIGEWLKSSAFNTSAKIRMTSIHYCLNTTKGAVILIGAAPERVFFRSETIFLKAATSMILRN